MPKRIPLSAIGVSRDGKTIYPTINELFDFSSEEVAQVVALEKADGIKRLRKPVNEGGDVEGSAGAPAAPTGKVTTTKTVAELKALAESNQVDLGDATKKDEIIAKLLAADVLIDAPAEEDEDL